MGGTLYVTYAKQDAMKHDDVAGPGNGYVALFNQSGNLLGNLISHPGLSQFTMGNGDRSGDLQVRSAARF